MLGGAYSCYERFSPHLRKRRTHACDAQTMRLVLTNYHTLVIKIMVVLSVQVTLLMQNARA